MLRKRTSAERRIFFPWERRGGLLRRLGLHRIRPFLFGSIVVCAMVGIGIRERTRAGIRQTRAVLLTIRAAMDTYLADHDGECPPGLDALTDYGSFQQVPRDAWGRPFQLLCPGRREFARYEVFSDGPDGRPGGLDRIE
jgi:hypothetical protein